jgi:hypothetical protein
LSSGLGQAEIDFIIPIDILEITPLVLRFIVGMEKFGCGKKLISVYWTVESELLKWRG